ncbi:hypothetical protein E7T06_07735 [Deinococcus sp. Arct2-2]|uniref:fimbria/pilus outer membrane usher protein n=1 Tax=Deinococcus sp. Arct2-2 TaxID=2568653 RepID=UPI0010A4C24B|nr:fimbria/pilus outer membrane usher protein [Deinococcus sp. Arct2-2]THF70354.1 hypothetical protein E7T06_07735 [Deinococcus sp. Arct2-2]
MSRHLNGLLTAFLLSSAVAQSAPPPAAPVPEEPVSSAPALVCPPDESFVEVRVAGLSRGGAWVRTGAADGRTWLQRSVIRAGEEAYFDAQLTCEDTDLVRLKPELRLQFDPEQLTLTFEPLPSLLGNASFTVTAPAAVRLPTLPLLNLDYQVSGGANVHDASDSRGAFDTRLEYVQGSFSSSIGVRGALKLPLAGSLMPYARLRYQPDEARFAQLAYNLPTTLSLWRGSFRGVQAGLRGGQVRYWPSLTFVLPLASDVRVSVDGQELQRSQLAPGTVTLRDLPLRQDKGSIVVSIEDETGQRSVSQPYSFSPVLLAPGSYVTRLEGGWLGDQVYAAGAAQYGLTPSMTLEGEAGVKGGAVQANVWAVFAPVNQVVRLGIGTDTSGETRKTSLKAQYRFAINAFNFGVDAEVPVEGTRDPQLELGLRYAAPRFNAGLTGGYNTAQNGWYGRLDGSVPVNAQLNVASFVAVTSRSTRVGIGVNWIPQPNVQVQTSAVGGPGSPGGVNASVNYQLNPTNRIGASTDFQNLAFSYQFRDQVEVDVAASTQGDVGVQVQGRATLVEGKLSFAASSGSRRFILLKTGIPDLGISAEGLYQGRTNAQGELLLSVQASSGSQIQVDLNTLPIEVSLRAETLVMTLPTEGAVVMDWRDNFTRSRFVTFVQAAGQPASGGSVQWAGQDRIDLDDQGEGLLPALAEAVTGILTFEDGRTCPVQIGSAATTVTCDL